ncbi:hypothetical protein ABFX02_12G077100 [Erythranthe guttata]
MNTKIAIICVLVVVAIVGDEVEVARAQVSCDPAQLSPCASTIFFSSQPSNACCTAIRQQIPCLCQYQSDPTLQGFINSPAALRISTFCNVPFPTNCPSN